MINWITGVVKDIGAWLGDGVASFFEWLLGGVSVVFEKIIDAAGGFWDVLDSIWNFAVGFKDSIFGLFTTLFPFVPAPVLSVISLGLVAVLIAGIVKKVRG